MVEKPKFGRVVLIMVNQSVPGKLKPRYKCTGDDILSFDIEKVSMTVTARRRSGPDLPEGGQGRRQTHHHVRDAALVRLQHADRRRIRREGRSVAGPCRHPNGPQALRAPAQLRWGYQRSEVQRAMNGTPSRQDKRGFVDSFVDKAISTAPDRAEKNNKPQAFAWGFLWSGRSDSNRRPTAWQGATGNQNIPAFYQ